MSMAYPLQNVLFPGRVGMRQNGNISFKTAIFKQQAVLSGATISACRRRIAAIPMSCFPLRLGVFAGLLALLVTGAVPAHARHTARNPNNPEQNQVQQGTPDQTVNTVPAQADQPQYGGYVPSAYPPSSAGQPSSRPQYVPQYQPNAYIGTVPPSTSGAPNQYPNQTPNQGRPGGSPVPSPQASAPAAQSSSAIGIADQYPPKPPRVSFRNGQLSIIAENSTLP